MVKDVDAHGDLFSRPTEICSHVGVAGKRNWIQKLRNHVYVSLLPCRNSILITICSFHTMTPSITKRTWYINTKATISKTYLYSCIPAFTWLYEHIPFMFSLTRSKLPTINSTSSWSGCLPLMEKWQLRHFMGHLCENLLSKGATKQ